MAFGIDNGAWNQVFAVPCAITDEHLLLAPDSSLRIILYLLRHAGTAFSLSELAAALHLPEGETADALSYWEGSGILGKCTAKPDMPMREETPETAPTKPGFPVADRVTLLSATAPHPDRGEVAKRLGESSSLRFLLDETSVLFGKQISPTEASTLVYLHDFIGMPCELILMAAEYCRSIGKAKVRETEKLILKWADADLFHIEDAEQYIEEHHRMNEAAGRVSTLFGINGRALSDKEKQYISVWVKDYGFTEELIKEAYNRAIDSKGTLRFSYINGILGDWFRKGIRRTADLARLDRKPAAKKPGKTDNVRYSTESSIDTDKIRMLEDLEPDFLVKGEAK